MRSISFAAAVIAATAGAGVMLIAPAPAEAQSPIIDQCVNGGRLVSTAFCNCRVYWDTNHRQYLLRRGAATVCADHGNQTVGSLNPIRNPGPRGGGGPGGGGPGGGGGGLGG